MVFKVASRCSPEGLLLNNPDPLEFKSPQNPKPRAQYCGALWLVSGPELGYRTLLSKRTFGPAPARSTNAIPRQVCFASRSAAVWQVALNPTESTLDPGQERMITVHIP